MPDARELAKPFLMQQGPHEYGKPSFLRDVDEALASGTFHTNGKAAAIVRTAKQASTRRMFSRMLHIAPGTVVVESFAARSMADGLALLDALPARALFVIYEEDVIAKACMEEAGYVWIDTKVEASSTLRGYYGCGVGLTPLTDPAELATLTMLKADFLSQAQLDAALAEVEQAGEFAQHYAKYNKRRSWSALALQGYGDDPSFVERPDEMSKAWKAEHEALLGEPLRLTTLAPRCPVLMFIADSIPGKKDRIRLMKLRAKDGELTRHADTTLVDAGVADGKLARLHIPLVTNNTVTFAQWDARGTKMTGHFPAGSLFYLDQRKPHMAVNAGTEDRVHLVLDISSSESLRKQFFK